MAVRKMRMEKHIERWITTEEGNHLPIYNDGTVGGQKNNRSGNSFADGLGFSKLTESDEKELEEAGKAATQAKNYAGEQLRLKTGKGDEMFDEYTKAWNTLEKKFTDIAPKAINTYGDKRFHVHDTTARILASSPKGNISMAIVPGGVNDSYMIKVTHAGGENYKENLKDAFSLAKELLEK